MSELQRLQANADSLSRQTQINDWEASAKLETLFLLQLAFVGLMILCILAYISSAGIISRAYVFYIAFVFVGILAYLGISRWLFTQRRTHTSWTELQFAGDHSLSPIVSPDLVKQTAEQLLAEQRAQELLHPGQ
jgi:small-conductance mechanosensitive channel